MGMIIMMWNRDDALILMPKLEAIAKFMGYHVALGGSVMYNGESKKDLDVIVYPHKNIDPHRPQPTMLLEMFTYHKLIDNYTDIAQTEGMDRVVYCGCYHLDTAKRIDFFFV
jgi:hypothetical protein